MLYVASDRSRPAVRESLRASVPVSVSAASGQLELRSFAEVYGSTGDLAAVASGFRAAAARARADGFPALRVAAEMGDFSRLLGSADRAVAWERMSTRLQRDEGVSSVCQYDRRRLGGTEAALIGAAHDGAAPDTVPRPLVSFLAAGPEPGDRDPGLRISGELDWSNSAELGRVLRARLAVSPRLRLDVAGLSYADLSAIRELLRAADALPADGVITLASAPPVLRRILQLADLRHPRLVVGAG